MNRLAALHAVCRHEAKDLFPLSFLKQHAKQPLIPMDELHLVIAGLEALLEPTTAKDARDTARFFAAGWSEHHRPVGVSFDAYVGQIAAVLQRYPPNSLDQEVMGALFRTRRIAPSPALIEALAVDASSWRRAQLKSAQDQLAEHQRRGLP
jgi:hypothetical protein